MFYFKKIQDMQTEQALIGICLLKVMVLNKELLSHIRKKLSVMQLFFSLKCALELINTIPILKKQNTEKNPYSVHVPVCSILLLYAIVEL